MFVNGAEVAVAENLDFSEFTCEPDSAIKLGNDDESHPTVGSFKYFLLFKTALAQDDIDFFMGCVKDRIVMPNLTAK